MIDDERIAVALRRAGFFYNVNDAGKFCAISDEEVLRVTEGTMLRARVELSLAVDDFIEVTKKELSVPVMWILRALTRLTNWFADR